jgi:hypothetical protein
MDKSKSLRKSQRKSHQNIETVRESANKPFKFTKECELPEIADIYFRRLTHTKLKDYILDSLEKGAKNRLFINDLDI